ncbi:SGNH/GDSL hydrolase family protein [Sphingobium yanoikuyae]|uniref:SGNH hydrolase-type esterase domain-containing protein n=1 Tax=Sphingobium yanoikuyae TaxID=13690 RepID=A0A3G2UTG9_SPHYA|nr:GDSL-type esterase/lipase family protein [Sphingobium yanoikuyae]AYO78303.1 hypothetical protein EBF16_16260 [Sphingobium yanoikuyae]
MTGKQRWMIIGATCLVTLIAGGGLAYSLMPTPVPSTYCWGAGDHPNPLKVLVVGESWAAGGRLLPEAPQALNKRFGRSAIVCSVGFSGANTRKQLRGLKAAFDRQGLVRLFGSKPDKIVIITGVNDIIQRRGSMTYKDDISNLVEWLQPISDDISILEIPNINLNSKLSPIYKAKQIVFEFTSGEAGGDLLKKYRSSITDYRYTVISYDDFIQGWATAPVNYTPDGIHLTTENFHKLGGYIGEVMPVRSVQPK